MDWNLSRGAVVVDCCRRRGSNYCSYCHRHTHRRCGSCIALCCGKVTAASIYSKVFALIRKQSPMTLISPYHGDVCATTESLYTRSAPQPNTTDSTGCTDPTETGDFFHPSEMHGITIQEGPDGNSDEAPTYWFWRPWACAKNITGCPWVGHGNASRIFDSYIATVGHGAVLNMNIPPTSTGKMNASVVAVMAEAGKAINDTFKLNSAGKVLEVSAPCGVGVASVFPTGEFDYIVSAEDLRHGQRVGNYSIEFRRNGSQLWEMLVPPVVANTSRISKTLTTHTQTTHHLGDRPDGHDPRDSHVGHKRIDVPFQVTTSGAGAVAIAEVRFNCISKVQSAERDDNVYLRQFSLHLRKVPWMD
eukprot:m.184931 g.184931  ORF g.184931 m.184931 type:complete len:360 (+) comp32212_c0_seq9:8-1087(+)